MNDSSKRWAIGIALVLAIGGWFWWKHENPTLLSGTYSCEGHTVQVDGARSLINASAEVVDGKIRPGATGADLAIGHQVMSWGDVEKSSRVEFLAQIHPGPEITDTIADPFWIACHRD